MDFIFLAQFMPNSRFMTNGVLCNGMNKPPLDARDRLLRLMQGSGENTLVPEAEEREHFIGHGKQAVERWYTAKAQLQSDWGFLGDFRPVLCPQFQLSSADETVAAKFKIKQMQFGQNELPLFYLSWERCSTTQKTPNPYEPLIAIWENGGAFRREGNLWEISGTRGPVGGIGWPTTTHKTVLPAVKPKKGETPEQLEARRKRVAMLQKWSTGSNGKPLPTRAAKGILFLIFFGAAFLISGLTTWNSVETGSDSMGWAVQILGPRGNSIFMLVLGIALLGWGSLWLVRAAKAARRP